MKLDSKVLVAVAMMLGAAATAGCKKSEPSSQPEITPVVLTPEAPTEGSAAPAASADAPAASSAAPAADGNAASIKDKLTLVAASAARQPAPPALRDETPGAAPSAHHVWQRGYWRYDAPRAEHVWVPGYWEDVAVRAPAAPPAVIYEDPGYAPSDEYVYAPGYWRYTGREYAWVYGHWTLRRDAAHYYRADWVRVNGRWVHRPDRWNTVRVAAWERTHHERYVPRGHEVPRHEARPQAHGHAAPAPHAASRPAYPHMAPEHRPRPVHIAPERRAANVGPSHPVVHRAPAVGRMPMPARAAGGARRGRG